MEVSSSMETEEFTNTGYLVSITKNHYAALLDNYPGKEI